MRVAPSAYWRHAARQRDLSLRCAWARRDEFLIPHVQRLWQANVQVYVANKLWLLEPIGYIPSAEAEDRYNQRLTVQVEYART